MRNHNRTALLPIKFMNYCTGHSVTTNFIDSLAAYNWIFFIFASFFFVSHTNEILFFLATELYFTKLTKQHSIAIQTNVHIRFFFNYISRRTQIPIKITNHYKRLPWDHTDSYTQTYRLNSQHFVYLIYHVCIFTFPQTKFV